MFYLIFQHIAIVLSVVLNGTLIALILKGNRREFGAYRQLLVLFASVDIYYGLVHYLIQPIPEVFGNAFFMGAHGHITGKAAVCFYATAHSHSYVVIVFHFMYRLLVVKGSPQAQLFSKPWFFGVIFVCGAAVGACWFAVMYWLYDSDDFVVGYLKPILQQHAIAPAQGVHDYVTAVFWTNGTFIGARWKPISGVVVMAATMAICYGYMVHAAFEIGRFTKLHTGFHSERTTQMSRQLMRALMYQTLLPVITAYSPPLVALSVPMLGLYFPYVADISPIFFGLHPLLDGCIIIYTIKEYRMLQSVSTMIVVFTQKNSVLSVLLNGSLIALILEGDHRREFGAYRHLLVLFVSVDIYYGVVHYLIQPIPEVWANAFFMAAHGHIKGKVAVCFYATVHSHSYIVLLFHFTYRLLAIKGSRHAELFSKPWFFGVIFATGAVVGASWYAVMYWLYDSDDFVVDYLRPVLQQHAIIPAQDVQQFVTAVFWFNGTFVGPRWKPISGVGVMALTMATCYGYMVHAAFEIGRFTRLHSGLHSERTIQMTKQLMRALMYQTILPVITAYSPPLIALSVPLLGLYFPYVADISPIFFGLHPLLDGCVIIYTIKEYRNRLISWFRRCQHLHTNLRISHAINSFNS